MIITQEQIEFKVEELTELIKNFEGSKSDAAQYAIEEIVTWAAYNHYEGVGILTESLMSWRKCSIEVLEEEEFEKEATEKNDLSN